MKSKIYTSDAVKNKEAHPASNRVYFYTDVYFDRNPAIKTPTPVPAMFTHHQINVAIKRAKSNPEDIPEKDFHESFWDKVKAALRFWE